MTSAAVVIAVFGLITIIALGALYVDSSARARAWRRIADERRWNEEHRRIRP